MLSQLLGLGYRGRYPTQANPLEGFRPEYIDAVNASRWNLWLIPLFLAAPTLLSFTIYRRNSFPYTTASFFGSVTLTWFSLYFYVEHIWNAMELNAHTDAEWNDVTADTGRLFGPILVGIPFAIIYSFIWLVGCLITLWMTRSLCRCFAISKKSVPTQTYEEYRESLVNEFKQNANTIPGKTEDAG